MNIAEGVAATLPRRRRARPLTGTGPLGATATAARTIGSTPATAWAIGSSAATAARPIGRTTAATARTIAGATTIAKIGLPTARLEHLIAAAAAEVHAVLTSTTNIVIAELLLDIRVVVFHALPMWPGYAASYRRH